MIGSAEISLCGRYRYELRRCWDFRRPAIAWIGLNPSTADADQDDPTLRRCIGFSQAWGYGALVMLNLFALRATDPRAMLAAPEPEGPRNDEFLCGWAGPPSGRFEGVAAIVCAWGNHGAHRARAANVLQLLGDRYLLSLGVTKHGHPRHPLYVAGDTLARVYPNPLVENCA